MERQQVQSRKTGSAAAESAEASRAAASCDALHDASLAVREKLQRLRKKTQERCFGPILSRFGAVLNAFLALAKKMLGNLSRGFLIIT